MPVYEYECVACGLTTEAMQKFSDAPLTVCPECCGQLKKLISNTSFVLKGTGWYVTDYGRKGSEPKKEPASKDAKTGTGTKTEATPDSSKETKPETKKEPASA